MTNKKQRLVQQIQHIILTYTLGRYLLWLEQSHKRIQGWQFC